MYPGERLTISIVIWIAMTIICVAAVTNSSTMDNDLIPFIVLIAGASGAAATRFVWNATLGITQHPEQIVKSSEKAKRDNRISQMLDLLNEDEIDELRERLFADNEGEVTSLQELLAEREARTRRNR